MGLVHVKRILKDAVLDETAEEAVRGILRGTLLKGLMDSYDLPVQFKRCL